MYECYTCGEDRGGSGMRSDGNCVMCGPIKKKALKRRIEELSLQIDRLREEIYTLKKEGRDNGA